MKVKVYAVIRKLVTFTLDEDYDMTEDEILDKAWEVAYDYVGNSEDLQDVDWEVIEGEG